MTWLYGGSASALSAPQLRQLGEVRRHGLVGRTDPIGVVRIAHLVIELRHLRFIKVVPCNWLIVTMPIFGGKESETALAEPFEAPALAAFP